MARRYGLLAEMQRTAAQRQAAIRAAEREAAALRRSEERERRAAEREAVADEKDRRRLHVAERKATAATMTREIEVRISELSSVLTANLSSSPPVAFRDMRRVVPDIPFDPGDAGVPTPTPDWTAYEPASPGTVARLFGGSTRYERRLAEARDRFTRDRMQHEGAERQRHAVLVQRREVHEGRMRVLRQTAARHNAEIDRFEHDVRECVSEAIAQFFTLVLDATPLPDGFPHRTRILFEPDPRHLVVECELPPKSVVPTERAFQYVQTRDAIEPRLRPVKDVADRYRDLIAQVVLRELHDVFTGDPADVVRAVTVNGRLSTVDPGTGQPVRPHLVSVSTNRDVFSGLRFTDLDPVQCLRRLGALVSPHPYELEPVRPMADFEALLARFKFVEGMDAVAGLDARPDLLDMSATEFEHFVRQLFEAMGMKSWTTQASKDDGVDAVAVNEDPVFGGLCVIQAKRYRSAVGVEAMRALAGTMEDMRATKGIMVTTSWVTRDGHAFAARHGRLPVIEGADSSISAVSISAGTC